MSQFNVNIKIAGRVYPMNAKSTTEEQGLRTAEKKINTLISQFEQNYEVADKQDVLAMCALQFASMLEINSLQKDEQSRIALETINDLTKLVESHLQ